MLDGGRHANIAWTTSRRNRRTGLFGGNSNWRGPIWFPVNFLLIESLQKFHHYLRRRLQSGVSDRLGTADDALGSGRGAVAAAVAHLPARRDGRRPVYGGARDASRPIRTGAICMLFYEYFHGDNGAGLGASHQTGWTALVAKLLQQTDSDGRDDGQTEGLASLEEAPTGA